jgi:transposase
VGAYQNVAAAKLPNARCTIDRFHVMKNLNDALTKARRSIQKDADENTKNILKGCCCPLVKNKENLKAEDKQKLDEVFTVSQELAICYGFKETFRDLFNQQLDFKSAEEHLLAWVTQVEACKYKALKAFAKTLRNWWTQILNYFTGRHNNGFAEGVYLKIKMLNRRGYGYRNFDSFRLHVLVSFG